MVFEVEFSSDWALKLNRIDVVCSVRSIHSIFVVESDSHCNRPKNAMRIRTRDENLNLNFVSLFDFVYSVEFTCNPCYWFTLIYWALESWAWNYKLNMDIENGKHYFLSQEEIGYTWIRTQLASEHFNSFMNRTNSHLWQTENAPNKNTINSILVSTLWKRTRSSMSALDSGEHTQKIQQHIHVKSWAG